jgi:hypothetical protein
VAHSRIAWFWSRLARLGSRAAVRASAVSAVAAGLCCDGQVRVEGFAELADVLVGQVDGVGDSVESEFDGAVRVAAVKVVGQKGDDLLRHNDHFQSRRDEARVNASGFDDCEVGRTESEGRSAWQYVSGSVRFGLVWNRAGSPVEVARRAEDVGYATLLSPSRPEAKFLWPSAAP